MLTRAILVFAVLVATSFASAPTWAGGAGGDILAACVGAPGTEGSKICDAYLNGLLNGIVADQVAAERHVTICIEGTITPQLRTTVVTFLASHPELQSLPSGVVVTAAIAANYLCRD